MRSAYFFLGLGFLIILAALLFIPKPLLQSTHPMLSITSSRFEENGTIPVAYTCDGAGTSPALSIAGVPAAARSLVLIVDDPDIPQSVKDSLHVEVIDHWVVFNMPATVIEIPDGGVPPGVQGSNTRGNPSYAGPCPPDREHRYFFRLYALDETLPLPVGATRAEVERAMQGHIIESATLIGRYDRSR